MNKFKWKVVSLQREIAEGAEYIKLISMLFCFLRKFCFIRMAYRWIKQRFLKDNVNDGYILTEEEFQIMRQIQNMYFLKQLTTFKVLNSMDSTALSPKDDKWGRWQRTNETPKFQNNTNIRDCLFWVLKLGKCLMKSSVPRDFYKFQQTIEMTTP